MIINCNIQNKIETRVGKDNEEMLIVYFYNKWIKLKIDNRMIAFCWGKSKEENKTINLNWNEAVFLNIFSYMIMSNEI